MSELERVIAKARGVAEHARYEQNWEYDHATVVAWSAVEKAFTQFADELEREDDE
jgi:hypothetical protein